MDGFGFLSAWIEENGAAFKRISDEIWDFAELRFLEHRSCALQSAYLERDGFSIYRSPGGVETSFVAEYGSGKPVIAFLGEYDALERLSQVADLPEHCEKHPGGAGHGCGHNLLGAGAMAAACALKSLAGEKNLPGTIRYYGCAAEEGAGAKAYLVRDGCFDDCDIVLTWHPAALNRVLGHGSLANLRVFFDFYGVAAHAASDPHLGRSALDAVELMNVGANYMREHMPDAARIHYAIVDAGGEAPNVVQAHARVLYSIRAPEIEEAMALFDRITDVARGAALMTQTRVEKKLVAAYSNYIGNDRLAAVAQRNLERLLPLHYSDEEKAYLEAFHAAITDLDRQNLRSKMAAGMGRALAEEHAGEAVMNFAVPYNQEAKSGGSTDVGDVSWVAPTLQLTTATWAYGTSGHSWQVTAQGKSPTAHKAMLLAAKVMACTAFEYLTQPELLADAKAEWLMNLDGRVYPSPLPADVKPEAW